MPPSPTLHSQKDTCFHCLHVFTLYASLISDLSPHYPALTSSSSSLFPTSLPSLHRLLLSFLKANHLGCPDSSWVPFTLLSRTSVQVFSLSCTSFFLLGGVTYKGQFQHLNLRLTLASCCSWLVLELSHIFFYSPLIISTRICPLSQDLKFNNN